MMKYAPLFKTEYIFEPGIKMDQIVAALHNSTLRAKWDNNVISISTVKKVDRVELLHIKQAAHKLVS